MINNKQLSKTQISMFEYLEFNFEIYLKFVFCYLKL